MYSREVQMLPLTQHLKYPDLTLGNGLGNGLEGKDFEGCIGVHKGPSIIRLEVRSYRQGVSEGVSWGIAESHLPPPLSSQTIGQVPALAKWGPGAARTS